MPLFVFLLICFGLYAIVQYGKKKAIEARRAKLLAWAEPFVKDQCFISVDASSLIGFDFESKEVFLACADASGKYGFSEIASCELLRDDVSLTQTNRAPKFRSCRRRFPAWAGRCIGRIKAKHIEIGQVGTQAIPDFVRTFLLQIAFMVIWSMRYNSRSFQAVQQTSNS